MLLANANHETGAIEQWRQGSLADVSFTDKWTARLWKTVRARQRAAGGVATMWLGASAIRMFVCAIWARRVEVGFKVVKKDSESG